MTSDTRIALITGGNKGIGLETARQLARKGITVVIGCRDTAKGQAAAATLQKEGLHASVVALEVTQQDSIESAARKIEQDYGRLDILINNAGVVQYGQDGTASTTSQQTLRETFDINFFGLVAVTQAFLPLLKKSPSGRIVNLSSVLGSIAEHADPNSSIHNAKFTAYDASKAAVNMYTNHLAYELRGTNLKVNAAHPGWVKTDMGGPDATLEIEDGAKTSVELALLPDTGPSGGFYHMGVHMRW